MDEARLISKGISRQVPVQNDAKLAISELKANLEEVRQKKKELLQ